MILLIMILGSFGNALGIWYLFLHSCIWQLVKGRKCFLLSYIYTYTHTLYFYYYLYPGWHWVFPCVYILKEIQRLQEDTDKANKHSSVLERDNQRMEIQIKDLSQQVRTFCVISSFFVMLESASYVSRRLF